MVQVACGCDGLTSDPKKYDDPIRPGNHLIPRHDQQLCASVPMRISAKFRLEPRIADGHGRIVHVVTTLGTTS